MRTSVFTVILFCMACCVGQVHAQVSIHYSYDEAGNRTGRESVAQLTALAGKRACRWQEPQRLASYQTHCFAECRTADDNRYVADYAFVQTTRESSFADERNDWTCNILFNPKNSRRNSHEDEI